MSSYEAVTLPTCWGADTSSKLTAAAARGLSRAVINDSPIRFVWRYVFFGEAVKSDIDADEARAICDAGLILLLVQHCRNPGWIASPDLGRSDGQWAARNAWEAGYEAGCALALDLEGLGNSGSVVAEHVDAWAEEVAGAGYMPVLYVGFQCGLTPEQLWELPRFARYWSDGGPRSVANRGFCCVQHPSIQIAGVKIDPDYAAPDELGGALVGMAEAKADTTPDLDAA